MSASSVLILVVRLVMVTMSAATPVSRGARVAWMVSRVLYMAE